MSLKFVVFDAEIGNPLYNIPSGTALLFGGGDWENIPVALRHPLESKSEMFKTF